MPARVGAHFGNGVHYGLTLGGNHSIVVLGNLLGGLGHAYLGGDLNAVLVFIHAHGNDNGGVLNV